ncbi:ROK family protein [Boseongicola aestuarii]|uniref:N-acetylglucosamine repressor n=1 Tax=Boseongicola aestuarii TaxID=1470561 RepID=A0A238J598_9RHOB|nr:ROK family protein [Boseongicola aestuarii]SMX25533.1 N-acetylglucosamine repressor [Boseongicola aestuarii]
MTVVEVIETNSDRTDSLGCGPLRPPGAANFLPLRQQIFEYVRAAGLIARVAVAKDLAISPGSVTALTAELIDEGYIHESAAPRRDADSGRGRPPVALGVNPTAGYVAGIKLSDQAHAAVILDFAGNRIAEAVIPRKVFHQSFSQTVDASEEVLRVALAQTQLKLTDLNCVGLGLPGVIDNETGVVPWSPLVSERDFPMRAALRERIGRPVEIDNDANLVTLAEMWFGAARSLSDFVVVTIEHGVGMGLVLNHRLYRGAQGLGTEIGHTKVQLDGALCRCGQRGCLEAYVADYALVREASTALNWDRQRATEPHIMLESLYDHAKAGNAGAQAIFHRAGRYLALGLANVVNLFDPSLILLSGERMRYDYLYAEEVLSEMANLTLLSGHTPPKVEIHAWGDLLWAQGAAALALESATHTAISGSA